MAPSDSILYTNFDIYRVFLKWSLKTNLKSYRNYFSNTLASTNINFSTINLYIGKMILYWALMKTNSSLYMKKQNFNVESHLSCISVLTINKNIILYLSEAWKIYNVESNKIKVVKKMKQNVVMNVCLNLWMYM